jgi:hypothetical protein
MKQMVLLFSLLGTLAFASPNGSCGHKPACSDANPKSVMGTLHYALNIMKLHDDPQVRLALQSYRTKVAAIPSGMDTDAFKNAAFDRKMFLERSSRVQKANAQADLFEALYKLLDTEQKTRLHQLMAAHQYYMGALPPSRCDTPRGKSCDSKASCPLPDKPSN